MFQAPNFQGVNWSLFEFVQPRNWSQRGRYTPEGAASVTLLVSYHLFKVHIIEESPCVVTFFSVNGFIWKVCTYAWQPQGSYPIVVPLNPSWPEIFPLSQDTSETALNFYSCLEIWKSTSLLLVVNILFMALVAISSWFRDDKRFVNWVIDTQYKI